MVKLTVKLALSSCDPICRKGLQSSASLFYLLFSLLPVPLLLGCQSTTSTTKSPPVSEILAHKNTNAPFDSYGRWQAITNATQTAPITSWSSLPFPDLVLLLQSVAENNPNLQALHARYRSAQALLKQVNAGRLPTATLSANRTTGTIGSTTSIGATSLPTGDTYSLGTTLSWEMDVWGKLDQQVAAQQAETLASKQDWQAAILSTQLLTAQTYFQLQASYQHLALMQKIAQEQQRFIHLTQARYRAGIATRLDVAQAETQYYNSQKELLERSAQSEQQWHALVGLTGLSRAQLAEALTSLVAQAQIKTTHTQETLAPIPHLVPSQLIAQRPDIQAKTARVIAGNARLGYSQTAFLPTLTLSANLTARQRDWKDLLNLPNTLWSIGPALAHTLFDGGKRDAVVEQAQADYEQTIADYRQSILSAFEEIENNLTTALMLEQAIDIHQQTLGSAQTALTIAQSQYKAGTVDALTLISAQTQYWQAKKEAIDLYLRHWQAYLVLTKQLFQNPKTVQEQP
jgi:NodT family efflux transporter outer membrane factor (OMF) lipoprotein